MTVEPQKLADARALVRDVLSRKQTEANSPALKDGDVLTFAVALVEQHDAAWLQAQLSDPRFPKDARLQVGLQLRGPLRKPLLTALGAPAFVIGR